MSDAFNEGNDLFVDEDFDGAVASYTAAITGGFTKPQVYAKRAAAYIKCEKFAEALQDSNKAIELDDSNDTFFLRKGWVFLSSINIPPFNCLSVAQRVFILKNMKPRAWHSRRAWYTVS